MLLLFLAPLLITHVNVVDVVRGGVQRCLTPLQALQTATIDPARFLGLAEQAGSVQPGRVASFVLLEADPLEDIRNTTKIAGVVLRGRLLARRDLDDLLRASEAAAQK